jgi:hypothetical protein
MIQILFTDNALPCRYRSVMDFPCVAVYKELLAANPDAKVVRFVSGARCGAYNGQACAATRAELLGNCTTGRVPLPSCHDTINVGTRFCRHDLAQGAKVRHALWRAGADGSR